MPQYIMPVSETMRRNVDLILNNATPSDAPNASNIDITERPKFGAYDIKCTFFGDNRTNNERFEVIPFQINKLIIEQNFQDSYTDEISIDVSLMPVQYLQMYDNSRGLKCSLQFTLRDKEREQRELAPSIIKEYMVIFKNKTDIRKKYSKQALIPDKGVDYGVEQADSLIPSVELQLIELQAYNIRKVKFNFIARQVTVKDIILLICKLTNITKTAIVNPDNNTVYENFIIPPNMTFDQMMVYLQSYYGVYNKDIGFYFTDGTLYVYPAYETNPTTPESVHLYYVGNNYTGVEINHAYANEITHIMLNSFASVRDLQDEGVEQLGSTMILHDATRVIDKATIIGESGDKNKGATGLGKVVISELNTNVFSPKADDFGMAYNAYQPMFRFDDSNPYRYRSQINSYLRSVVTTSWNAAVPFTFKAGYKLHYHYDGENIEEKNQTSIVANTSIYSTKTGICTGVNYSIKPIGKVGNDWIYGCTADIVLSLAIDPGNQEPQGDTVSDVDNARSTKEASTGGGDVASLSGAHQGTTGGNATAASSMNAAGTGPKVGIF